MYELPPAQHLRAKGKRESDEPVPSPIRVNALRIKDFASAKIS